MHNDQLSFELNVAGRDIIVDLGTGVYTADLAIRNQFRSTENHSTVVVEGLEQNPWAPGLRGLFALPDRSQSECIEVRAGKFVGQHSGYGAVHMRTLLLEDDGILIEDTLAHPKPSFIILTLAPEVSPRLDAGNGRVFLHHGPVVLSVEPAPSGRPIHIAPGRCSEAYGAFRKSTKVVVGRLSASDSLRLRLMSGQMGRI